MILMIRECLLGRVSTFARAFLYIARAFRHCRLAFFFVRAFLLLFLNPARHHSLSSSIPGVINPPVQGLRKRGVEERRGSNLIPEPKQRDSAA
jgi:hypothetical protein